MTIFLMVLLAFLFTFACLGIGLLFRRPPLRRRCGEPLDCHCAAEGRPPAEYCSRENEGSQDRCSH